MSLHDDLAALRDSVRTARVVAGFLLFAAGALAAALVFALLAGANALPFLRLVPVRWAALLIFLAGAGAGFFALVVKPLLWNPTFMALARLAEERVAGLDNAYNNAV